MEQFEKRFDFYKFSVILRDNSLTYEWRIDIPTMKTVQYPIPTNGFENSIDPEEIGGKIHIKHIDRNGSKMEYIHFLPTDLQTMFEFIARGYRVPYAYFYGDGGIVIQMN